MNDNNELIVGVDIGGSHITAGLVDLGKGAICRNQTIRKSVDRHGRAADIIHIWAVTIREVWDMHGIKKSLVGFAMPGPFDYLNGISMIRGFDKYEKLFGYNIGMLLSAELGIEPQAIRFRNDAEAFLQGEMHSGAAKGCTSVIGVTLGTGLGTARFLEGYVLDAGLSILPMHSGMAEDYISTRGMVRAYRDLSGFLVKDVEALAALHEREPHARETFRKFAADLAAFLKVFIEMDRPGLLIIGGNISKAWHLFMPDVVEALKTFSGKPSIVRSRLGENASLIGAACCFLSEAADEGNSFPDTMASSGGA